MYLNFIKEQIVKILQEADFKGEVVLGKPPKQEMGDLALSCFACAKELHLNPAEAALEIKNRLLALVADTGKAKKKHLNLDLVEKVEVMGPYVNFYLNATAVAREVLQNTGKKDFGRSTLGKDKKVLAEFAQPNTHKAFHIGHLRGTMTGESVSRILENAGYEVVRVNYQGDVGMHIAKCLWGIGQLEDKYNEAKKKTIEEKVKFLGEAYAFGAQAFEEKPSAKDEITAINEKIYFLEDAKIKKVYTETRKWSLAYFDGIYKKLGTHFDRLYFESEMFRPAIETVKEFLRKEVLVQSQGAVIFPGSKYSLHDRVFLNTLGLPTYEAKDLALAKKQFAEYSPDEIFHVVAREQTEYFKVLFKVLEEVVPESKGREKHLPYGWVTLKEGKMSSRTGKVVLGEWLIAETAAKVAVIMKDSGEAADNSLAEQVALGAIKYSFLKTSIKNDIVFDFNASVSLSGDSGAYLLYTVARMNSILEKAGTIKTKKSVSAPQTVAKEEKQVLLKLAEYAEATEAAAREMDPSEIAKYLLDLSQAFNNFYHEHDILKAGKEIKAFRLDLVQAVRKVMIRGLDLLGIEAVERM